MANSAKIFTDSIGRFEGSKVILLMLGECEGGLRLITRTGREELDMP